MVELLILPVTGAFIGWITNLLAIRLLFRPRKPLVIPLAGYSIQGLLPRRRYELSRTIGEVVERELLSNEMLSEHILRPEVEEQIILSVKSAVERRLMDVIPSIIPASVAVYLAQAVGGIAERETALFFHKGRDRLVAHIREGLDIRELVEDRLNELNLDELEKIVYEVAGQELKHIELLGGVLGFIIGIVQAVIVIIFK